MSRLARRRFRQVPHGQRHRVHPIVHQWHTPGPAQLGIDKANVEPHVVSDDQRIAQKFLDLERMLGKLVLSPQIGIANAGEFGDVCRQLSLRIEEHLIPLDCFASRVANHSDLDHTVRGGTQPGSLHVERHKIRKRDVDFGSTGREHPLSITPDP